MQIHAETHFQDSRNSKGCGSDSGCDLPHKARFVSDQQPSSPRALAEDSTQLSISAEHQRQLLSPSLLKTCCVSANAHAGDRTKANGLIEDRVPCVQVLPATRKRRARSLDYPEPTKKSRLLSQPAESKSPIDKWLSHLPPRLEDFEETDYLERIETMSQPPLKRLRSSYSLGLGLSQSGNDSDGTISRSKKYSAYKDVNYRELLETKGSFMRSSLAGLVDEDKELCKILLTASQPIPSDPLFDDERFERFHSLLQGRSEARVCVDLHPRMVPSVENLYLCGREEFGGLIEGHNDLWVKSIPFYGPRPQPDHTFGFKWSNFTEQQRRKLQIEPTEKSYYTARQNIYFPFLTSEVKCGNQALDCADNSNVHSMTVALRGIVDLYRNANRTSEVHRRALGFSISHDNNGVRMYVHYPEINGDETTFWRDTLKKFDFDNEKGKEKWVCYQFTLNVCQIFALPLVERLKAVIDQLPDPITRSLEAAATFEEPSVFGSQDDASALESQDEGSRKRRNVGGLNAELRNMIQSLQRQMEQQKQMDSLRLEQQRTDAKEREAGLMKMLKEQSDRMKEQSDQIKELLQKR